MFLAAVLLCSGCSREEEVLRTETVVWIPVNPTEASAASEESEPETGETDVATEEPGETESVPETEAPKQTGSNSGGKKPSSGKNSGTTNKNHSTQKQTEPTEPKSPETEPPATESTETAPPETESDETIPAETEPPETEPEKKLYDISGYSVGSLEYAVRDRINGARAEAEIGELSMSARLCAIASCRAYEISQVWSHTRPDGRGYATVLGDYGYGAGTVTELLVYVSGSGDGDSVVSQWLDSDSHRSKLLSTGYTTVGIGTYRVDGCTYICCLLVG